MTNKDLLSESKMYLDLTNSLNDLNKSCLTMFNTMLKTMDIYSKVRYYIIKSKIFLQKIEKS